MSTLPSATSAASRPAWRVWLRRLAPWVITAIVVYFILREYPIERIAAEVKRGNALAMVPSAAALAVGVLVLVVAWDTLVIRGVFGGPRYVDVFRAKAASGVLQTLGYGVGQGGYAVWIARVTGARVADTVGVALFISASDLAALCLLATATIWIGGVDVPAALRIAPPAIAGVLLGLILVGPLRLLRNPPRVLRPWRELPRARSLLTIAGRTLNLAFITLGTWAAARGFGLDLPLAVVASYLPVVILVASLPINVAGFGAVQGSWLIFEPWADGASILAFQFLWHLMIGAGLILRGAPFVRRVVAEIDAGRARGGEPPGPRGDRDPDQMTGQAS